jgi:hypothetical protein
MLIPYGTDSNAFRPKGVKSYGVFPAILSSETVARCSATASASRSTASARPRSVFFEALKATLEIVIAGCQPTCAPSTSNVDVLR